MNHPDPDGLGAAQEAARAEGQPAVDQTTPAGAPGAAPGQETRPGHTAGLGEAPAPATTETPHDRYSSISGCTRCGGDHPNMTFGVLQRPIADSDGLHVWTHWAPCPKTGEPVLLRDGDLPEVGPGETVHERQGPPPDAIG